MTKTNLNTEKNLTNDKKCVKEINKVRKRPNLKDVESNAKQKLLDLARRAKGLKEGIEELIQNST
jgi:hypothetical protein